MLRILCYIVFLTLAAGSIAVTSAQSDDDNVLRIATYNLSDSGSGLVEGTANLIAQSGAGVILLQQLDANEAYLLARQVEMEVAFFLVTDDAQGLAVLSKTGIAFDDGHILSGSDNLSAIQRVQIFVGAQSLITFYNVGLGFNQDDMVGMTEEQLSEIFTIMVADNPDTISAQRLVVGGTFNDISDTSIAEQMDSNGFSDPFLGLPLDLSATLQNTTTQSRVDYLWLRNLSPVGASVVESSTSDRHMAVVEIQLEGF